MSEYNQIINNFNAAMQGMKKGGRAAGDALNSIPKNVVSPMTDALLNTNVFTAPANIGRQAIPAAIDAIGGAGDAINSNPGVANALDNPGLNLLNFLPGVGPAATIINTGIKGSRAVSTMRGDAASNDTPKPTATDVKQEPYTVMGVTYDPTTGQAIQPDTGKIAPGGYSVPASGTDTSSGDREALRTGTENERMTAWAEANPELAKRVVAKGPKQSGYDAIENVVFEGAEAPEAKELTEEDMASYDNLETFKPSEMKAGDRQDPIAGRDNILNSYFPGARAPYSEEAFGAKLQDAQVFEGGINPNAAQIAEVDPQEFLRARMSPRNR